MTKFLRRPLAVGSVLGLMIGLWFLFAPRQLGGSVSYTVITGSSMEPLLHGEDLAIVRENEHYQSGDVVAYRSHSLGRIVLHRIVGRKDGHFILKGDNNSWLDSDKPDESDVIGKLWLRVPGAGRYLLKLQEPRTASVLVGILTLLTLGLGGEKERRREAHPATGGRRRPDVGSGRAEPT